MSRLFMVAIGLLYLCAFVAGLFERKWAWAGVCLCWGVGGLLLAYLNGK
jgi:hypothetical protein